MRTLSDAIYGVAVGDALGVPFEFKTRGTFKAQIMTGNGTHRQPAGTWSDDTSLTLATCYSIKRKGGIDLDDIMACFRAWLFNNEFTAGGKVFDCGGTTNKAINQGHGERGIHSNGNGSLMRIIPLAFIEGVTDRQIRDVSALTHGHIISATACVIYVRLAQKLLEGKTFLQALEETKIKGKDFVFLKNILDYQEKDIKSGGYVLDTLAAALWCLSNTSSYKEAVLKAVNLGADTDTTAAVTGGLAGIIYGKENIPAVWLKILKNRNCIEDCLF